MESQNNLIRLSWIVCNTVSTAEVMKLSMKYAMIRTDEVKVILYKMVLS
jgi:hypothetical protein